MPAEQDLGRDEREIRKIAYELWLRDGQPEGRDHEHWTEAKEIWAFRRRDPEAESTEDGGSEALTNGVQPAAKPAQAARRAGSSGRPNKPTLAKGAM